MQFSDEREHTLREVAALGNVKATVQLAHSGVNLNSQNVMNGWTALHWAAHRGHVNVITALLKNGADPLIKTKKGQTALDLAANNEEAVSILRLAVGDVPVSVGPEPPLPIVPTYIKNPDLEKTWLMPEEFSENKLENVVRKQNAAESLQTPEPATAAATSDTKGAGSSNEELEVLVYLSAREDANLLGSVFLKNETIEEAIKQIKEEIDGLPENFNISRHNGKVNIPINSKQMNKRLLDIFRSENDVLIVIPL
ncbi:ankyrin repeat-containing domain protein [Pilaira anomala]|nr:ankyrin repeat-containing domain protein [Pilaira anomala]